MKVFRTEQIEKKPVDGALFTDRVYRQTMLAQGDSPWFTMSIVNFPKGVRNKWHTHDCDQLLVVTKGKGIVAFEDKEVEVSVGDVIHIPAGEKHWHGAGPDEDFAHITIVKAGSSYQQFED